MANSRKPEIDPIKELAVVVSEAWGSPLEAIAALMADPGAEHTAGELAVLGAAFSHVGQRLTNEAKARAAVLSLKEDAGVIFTHREPNVQERVNTKYLKANFPAVNYPEMYQQVQVAGSVAIDLPFRV